jgi:hypothetical protein
VPQCGALSLLQKTPHYRGVVESAARLKVNLWDLVVVMVVVVVVVASYRHLAQSFIYTEIKSRRGADCFAGRVKYSRVLVCASVLRALPPAAPPTSPVALSVPPREFLPAGPP